MDQKRVAIEGGWKEKNNMKNRLQAWPEERENAWWRNKQELKQVGIDNTVSKGKK